MILDHRLSVINNSIDLNFEINSYDYPILDNLVYMDFMEAFSVADIFTVHVVDIMM